MARRTQTSRQKIKVGIDVGGTFTHAVALDAATLELVGTAVVPTTHHAPSGVAEGVVASMRQLLAHGSLRPGQITLVAHSTTQATNALLEGDVARVGVLGMSPGRDVWRARGQSDVGSIHLAPGKAIRTCHRFFDSSRGVDEAKVRTLVEELRKEGAEVFAVSEAYGIEDPGRELAAAGVIRAMGYPVTAASEISQLYGLRVRTRTAVINACMLPKMLETADLTERSVREMGITAPLMIMRSDGGIMTVEEMRRRPILTMLSGPAAGVAAALMFVRISDGLFVEVGGTSTDISLIRNGRPMVRSAEIGGHRLYVRTLDIRTVGIGGGSMVRARRRKILDVGPRSAHIAGLRYPSFAAAEELTGPQIREIRPQAGDPEDYLAVDDGGETHPRFALTTTDAANMLGTPRGYARGNPGPVGRLSRAVTAAFGRPAEQVAGEILAAAAEKVAAAAKGFFREYRLDPSLAVCVGGGGGAEVIVPPAAERLGVRHSLAAHAEVISAIGVALGMIRDTIERSVTAPSAADILRIRAEAEAAVARMGASPASIEVFVEVDVRQHRLVATATGVPELRTGSPSVQPLPPGELLRIAAASCGLDTGACAPAGSTGFFEVFQGTVRRRRLFGPLRAAAHPVRVLDREGIVRLKSSNARVVTCTVRSAVSELARLIDEATTFGDAGGLEPDVHVLAGHRIIDLTGLVGREQMLSLLRTETERFTGTEPAVVLVSRKSS